MLTSISSSPMQVLDIAKVLPAKRAPEIGEHNEEILKELGFDPQAIDTFRDSEDDKISTPRQHYKGAPKDGYAPAR